MRLINPRRSLVGRDRGRGQHRHAGARLQLRAVRDPGRHPVLVSRGRAARRDGRTAAPIMTPWLLVAGDLTPLGGMDAANHALAQYLGVRGPEVHLVTHRAWPDLADAARHHRASRLAPVQSPSARQPAAVARRPASVASTRAAAAPTRSSTAGTAASRPRTGSTTCTRRMHPRSTDRRHDGSRRR